MNRATDLLGQERQVQVEAGRHDNGVRHPGVHADPVFGDEVEVVRVAGDAGLGHVGVRRRRAVAGRVAAERQHSFGRASEQHVGGGGLKRDRLSAGRPQELGPGALTLVLISANGAWLVLAVMAFNLTRAAATLAGDKLARATTGTVRRKLINVAARLASSARRITVHLSTDWPWEHEWSQLFTRVCGPPTAVAT